MTTEKDDLQALDALFDAARDRPAMPDAAFLARLHADADQATTPDGAAIPTSPPPRGFTFGRLLAALLPASGLTATVLVGVWIGASLPENATASAWLATGDTAEDVEISSFLPGASFAAFDSAEDVE